MGRCPRKSWQDGPSTRQETAAGGRTSTTSSSPATLWATVLFERELGVKTLFFSFYTADENLHAPNDYLADGPHRLAAAAGGGPHD